VGPPAGFPVLVSRPRVSMPTRRAVTSAPTFARPLGERIRAKLYLPESGRTKHVQNANSEPFGNALKRFNGLLFAAAPCNALTPTNAFQRIVSNVAQLQGFQCVASGHRFPVDAEAARVVEVQR
jgi:hypothetical protein